MDGIVLAGAKAPEELRDLGIIRVPLLRIGGVTILERTCRSMLEAGCESVFVLAPEEVQLPDDPQIRRAAYSSDVIDDMFGCLEREAGASHAILASSDMPLITGEALGLVVAAGRESGADIVYPAVERRVLEQRFPETKRTYVRLGALTVTGGNAVYVDRRWLLNRQQLIHELFANRKSIGKLAGFFGVLFLVRLLLGFAPIDYVERHLGKLLSGRLKAAVLPSVELGIDLDKLADLELLKDMIDPWDVPAEVGE